jgi:hypothetical protein
MTENLVLVAATWIAVSFVLGGIWAIAHRLDRRKGVRDEQRPSSRPTEHTPAVRESVN